MDLNFVTITKQIPKLIDLIIIEDQVLQEDRKIEKQMKIVINKKNLKLFLLFFKLNTLCQYKSLTDLFAIDLLSLKSNYRFQLNYYLLSLLKNERILLKINLLNNEMIETVMGIYNSSNWLEREIWDLFGIYFNHHNDLRRILTDYGFEGYALRKDFPLSGYIEICYTIEQKKINLKPLELSQEYRMFDFISPWTLDNNNLKK